MLAHLSLLFVPVAMGIAEQIVSIPALAAVFPVLTGLVGAISGKYLFDAIGGRSIRTRGFALGTASQGIGAARALQVDADACAYALKPQLEAPERAPMGVPGKAGNANDVSPHQVSNLN